MEEHHIDFGSIKANSIEYYEEIYNKKTLTKIGFNLL